MAAQKPTVVFSPAFSTIPNPCLNNRAIREVDVIVDRAEQEEQFKHTHRISRHDWDHASSLHLHGDLQ